MASPAPERSERTQSRQRPIEASVQKAITSNLPKFDGTDGVEEFFDLFEEFCSVMDADEWAMRTLLLVSLKDGAR